MAFSATLLTMGWLIRDTFRQALSSGIFWLMLGVSAVCIAVCLSVGIEGDDVARAHPPGGVQAPQGELTLAFGAIPTGVMMRDRLQAVRDLQAALGGWVAGTMGLLLTLLWTAGFLPSFLEPAAVSVLLAKPAPRWSLLLGKYLGVLVFVAFQGLVFVGGTWLALALRTGVWAPTYFLCLPLLLLNFAVFFGFSAMLAVSTRSTGACAFGSILFWMLCWGMNYGRHAARGISHLGGIGTVSELGYWLLPKPTDAHIILVRLLGADDFVTQHLKVGELAARGAWSPELSVLASLLAGLALLGVAAYEFAKADY